MFVASPMPLDSMTWQGDIGLALADDLVNQLLSGLWATGAITPTVKLEGPLSVLSAILDSSTQSLKIDIALGHHLCWLIELIHAENVLRLHNDTRDAGRCPPKT